MNKQQLWKALSVEHNCGTCGYHKKVNNVAIAIRHPNLVFCVMDTYDEGGSDNYPTSKIKTEHHDCWTV